MMMSNTFNINPSTIYVYLRVSTKTQTHKSNGLEEQNNICQEYIKKYFSHNNQLEIEYFTDVGSSYNEKNVLCNLNKIIKKISSQTNSLIVVRDISRLGRNTFQVFSLLRKIKKYNSHIISVDENLCYNYSKLMDKKFYHAIIDSEENSDLKSIKSINRIRKIKSIGGYIGRVPYGTQIIKKDNIPYIYKNPIEINTLRTIKKVFLKYLNIIKTTKYLNTKNIKYRNNIDWNEKQITNVVKKYFPNLTQNKKSDLVDKYFQKYDDYEQELVMDVNEISNKIVNINLETKPKRKYVKKN
jgi:DNA invertase Pin-like site-specific DNA recombinase